jgi:hypothetical protein
MHGYGYPHDTYTTVYGEWRIATLQLSRLRVDIEMASRQDPVSNSND